MSRRSKVTEKRKLKLAAPALPEVQSQNRWLLFAICVFLAAGVWAVFGQTWHYQFVNFDDELYVTDNPHVLAGLNWPGLGWAFTNLQAGFWHPLTWLSLMTDAQFYGLRAGGYHLTAVWWHMANTLLLFGLLRRMTGALWRSAVVAALFGWHPLHVESVAWIAERKDVLSTTFWMLTLWAYTRYAQPSKIKNQKSKIWYGLALLFFVLGLMSKPMLVTLPVIMLLLDYWPLQRFTTQDLRPTLPRLVGEKLPFLGLALAAGWLTIKAEKGVGALPDTTAFPLPLRAANAALSGVHYLWQMVWPTCLAVFYPYPTSYPLGWVLAAMLALAAISLVVLWRSRRQPYLAVGWFWYLITLAPVSGLIQVGLHARADRYTYVPLIGIFLMLTWGVGELSSSWPYRRVLLGWGATAMLAGLLVGAYVQTGYWQDSVSLWTHALSCTSESTLANNNLGFALAAQGKLVAAVQHYKQALQLDPDSAETHNNLGLALAAQGKAEEAVQQYERAIQIKPDSAEIQNNLGNALTTQGKWEEAIRHYERALQINPDEAQAHNNLGYALAAEGKLGEAVEHYKQALQLNPSFADAHNNLANALADQGRLDEAVQHYERALELKENDAVAHYNLGRTLAAQGKPDAATQHYERALQLNPDLAEAHINLGLTLQKQGKSAEAMHHFEQALQIKPNYPEGHFNLGNVLAKQGGLAQAIQHYERALQLNPNYTEAEFNLGNALAVQGKLNEAMLHFQQALNLAVAQNKSTLADVIRARLKSFPPAMSQPHIP